MKIFDNNVEKNIRFAVQFKEVLKGGKIAFIPEVVQIDNLDSFLAHQTIDFENKLTGILWKLLCTDDMPGFTVSYIIENFAIDLPVG